MIVLLVDDVAVACEGKLVVEYAKLLLHKGDVALLIGPNGSGKSSLLNAIAGHPRYKIVKGKVMLFGKDVTETPPHKRIEMGIGIAVQNPPRLKGVKLRALLENVLKKRGISEVDNEVRRIAKLLSIEHLLDREYGFGFSGGELKRAEMALLVAQAPRIALIDEPDSGVDVDSVMVIASAIEELMCSGTEAMLIVTHSGLIARHIKCSRIYVMLDKKIVLESSRFEILNEVLSKGFSWIKRGDVYIEGKDTRVSPKGN